MILYRAILKQAWQTTWRHKYLWFFGLFAALLGNGGELEIIFRGFGEYSDQAGFWREIGSTGFFSWQTLANIGYLFKSDPITMFMVILVFCLVAIIGGFLLWLTITGQAAVINNAAEDKFGRKHSFKTGFSQAIASFWPVFSLNLLSKLISYLLFVLISWPIALSLFTDKTLSYSLAYILLFVLFIPLSIIVSFVIKYGIAYVVVKKEKPLAAFKKGVAMFKNNWVVSIEMAFILFGINFLVGLSLFILFLVLAVPFLFIILAFSKIALMINFWFLLMSAGFLFVVFFGFAGAILSVFQISSWTNLFIELEGRGGISKLVRIFEKK